MQHLAIKGSRSRLRIPNDTGNLRNVVKDLIEFSLKFLKLSPVKALTRALICSDLLYV